MAPNLLGLQFKTSAPDQVWTADITYIPTREGWLYLAVVMDLYTRMIVGWTMDSRMTRELVMNALRMARFRRKPMPGLLHHSDRGSQYCSGDYQALLGEYGMIASMSRKGNCWDNAPMSRNLCGFCQISQNQRVELSNNVAFQTAMNSYCDMPSAVLRSTYARVRGSLRIRTGVDPLSWTIMDLIPKRYDVSPETGQFETTGWPLRWFALTSF